MSALRLRARSSGLGVLFLLLALLHTTAGTSATLATAAEQMLLAQGITLEVQDGLLTADFPDGADDTVLSTVMPSLVAQGVRSVRLHNAPVRDLAPLAQLRGLVSLDAPGTQVRDLGPLAGLTGLQSINLQFAPLRDLSPLAALISLRSLNLGGTDARDLTPLAALSNLQDLGLAVTKVDDLTPVARLHALVSLDVSGTPVADVTPITGLSALRSLNLNGTQVTDLRPLSGLINLQRLDLGGTQVSDVHALAGLRNLHWLDLEGTQVSDATPLKPMSELHYLALGGSRVRDVSIPEHPAVVAPSLVAQQSPTASDPVLYWNDQVNQAIQVTGTDPFMASRDLALESIAVLDTIRSLSGRAAFLVRLPRPEGVSTQIAVTAAAHAVLTHLFPNDTTALNAAMAAIMASAPTGPERDRALAFGEAVAEAVLMRREEDGAGNNADSRVGTAPGQWRPTPPDFLPAMHVEWATLTPFAMTAPSQFRPAGPPDINSEAYRQARATVARIGGAHSTERTADQTEIAHYWSDAIGTYAPAGHWNAIAANIVAPLQLGIATEAELLAELNVAIADSSIGMADAKYTFWSWRPITAIRAGDSVTAPLPSWTPLLVTPNHPSYVSGHSAFSGAAATVLTDWFGDRPFTFSSASLPGVTRHFTSFQQAADEAAASRVYGGIHFPFDNADGLAMGRAIGAWTIDTFQRLDMDRGPFLMVGGPMDMMASMDKGTVTGCALDNVSPVTAVTVSLDGAAPFSVPVDEHGLFALPASRVDISHRHDLVLAATSATGRTSTVHVAVGP